MKTEDFKAPDVTEVNAKSVVALSDAELPKGVRMQMANAMLRGLCQMERKRCFEAILAFFEHQDGECSYADLLQLINQQEYGLLAGRFGDRLKRRLDRGIEADKQLTATNSIVISLPK